MMFLKVLGFLNLFIYTQALSCSYSDNVITVPAVPKSAENHRYTSYRYRWSNKRTSLFSSHNESDDRKLVHINAIAAAGLPSAELPIILSAANAAVDHFGIEFVTDKMSVENHPAVPDTVPGATGRVLLLSLNNVGEDWNEDDERLEPFKNMISQEIDSLVGHQIEQPVLVSVMPNHSGLQDGDGILRGEMSKIVQKEVSTYGLRSPMVPDIAVNGDNVIPTIYVEIDGAIVPDPFEVKDNWDTSAILVFDDFIDQSLRKRLLDVINKRDEGYSWDDKVHGPDPKRWARGGLLDTPEGLEDGTVTECWGLREEAINELCFEEHSAIAEVERKIADLFAPDFECTRLPEAVLGACVSPLTANAPTHGDSFSYHIDADPNQTPPSPWTDVFGRYYNRVRGKPRFVSCLLYLNDEWDDSFGAPTQFYDPPTEEVYEVFPKPGRCVLMDQDVTHSVVAPTKLAGAEPRYSLVWKLILHPKKEKQNMTLFPNSVKVSFGSANADGQILK